MQKCKSACGLCKGANVDASFGSRVSDIGFQVQVFRFGCRCRVLNQNLNPYQNL